MLSSLTHKHLIFNRPLVQWGNNMIHTIDITGGTATGPTEIVFAKYGMFHGFDSWIGASRIVEMPENHEGRFGCIIGNDNGDKVSICTVEHAEALITALQCAIDHNFLFTDNQLKQHHKSITDTRRSIKARIRSADAQDIEQYDEGEQ